MWTTEYSSEPPATPTLRNVTGTLETDGGLGNETHPPVERNTLGAVSQHQFIIYVLIGLIGIIGNGFVVLVFLSAKRLRQKIVNMFLINQSLLDLVTSVLLIASAKNNRTSGGHYGIAGELFCRIWVFRTPLWAAFSSSTYNLLAVTLERYLAVCRPIQHKLAVTPRRTGWVIALIWLVGPLEHFLVNGFVNDARRGYCYQSINWPRRWVSQAVGIMSIGIDFVMPLAIMIIAYTAMIRSFRTRVAPSVGDTTNNNTATNRKLEKSRRIQKNILRTLVLVCACFFTCWVGNRVYFLFFLLNLHNNFKSHFYHFTVYAAFINCIINPAVYAAQYKDFQSQVWKLFSRRNNVFVSDSQQNPSVAPTD